MSLGSGELTDWLSHDVALTSTDLDHVLEVLHDLAATDLSVVAEGPSGAGPINAARYRSHARSEILKGALYSLVMHPNCSQDLLERLAALSITAVRVAQGNDPGSDVKLAANLDADRARDLVLIGGVLHKERAREVDERLGSVAVRRLRDPAALTRLACLPGYDVTPGTPVWNIPEDRTTDSHLRARSTSAPRTRLELALHPFLPQAGVCAMASDTDGRAAALALVHPAAPLSHVEEAARLGPRLIASTAGAPEFVLPGLLALWTTTHPTLLGAWASAAAQQVPLDELVLSALASMEQSWQDPQAREALRAAAHLPTVAFSLWSNAFWPTDALAEAQLAVSTRSGPTMTA